MLVRAPPGEAILFFGMKSKNFGALLGLDLETTPLADALVIPGRFGVRLCAVFWGDRWAGREVSVTGFAASVFVV